MAKTETPGAEIATRHSSNLAALDEFDGILLGLLEVPEIVQDPKEIQREIIAQILNAENEADLEGFGSATGWQELLDVPVRIDSFSFRPSEMEDGAPVYVIVNAERLDTAEPVVLTTGAYNVLAALSWLARRNKLPAIRQLAMAEKKTKAGFTPLWLVTPDAEKVRLAEAMATNPLDED